MGRLEGRVREYVREVEVKRLALVDAPRQWVAEEVGEMTATTPGLGLGQGLGLGLGQGLGMSGSIAEGDASGQGLGFSPGQGLGTVQGKALAVSFNMGERGDTTPTQITTTGTSSNGRNSGTQPSPGQGQGLASAPEQPVALDPELLENILLQESVIDQLGVDTLEAFVTQVTRSLESLKRDYGVGPRRTPPGFAVLKVDTDSNPNYSYTSHLRPH